MLEVDIDGGFSTRGIAISSDTSSEVFSNVPILNYEVFVLKSAI